jgi:hypothetical protein
MNGDNRVIFNSGDIRLTSLWETSSIFPTPMHTDEELPSPDNRKITIIAGGKKIAVDLSQLTQVKALFKSIETNQLTEIEIDDPPKLVETIVELLKQMDSSSPEEVWKSFDQTLQKLTFSEIYELFNFAERHGFEGLKSKLHDHIYHDAFYLKFACNVWFEYTHHNEKSYQQFVAKLQLYFLISQNVSDPYKIFNELKSFLDNFFTQFGGQDLLEFFDAFSVPKNFLFPLIAAIFESDRKQEQEQKKKRIEASERVSLATRLLFKFDRALITEINSEYNYFSVFYSVFSIAKNVQSFQQLETVLNFLHTCGVSNYEFIIKVFFLGVASLLPRDEIELKSLVLAFVESLTSTRPEASFSIIKNILSSLNALFYNCINDSNLKIGCISIWETSFYLINMSNLQEILTSEEYLQLSSLTLKPSLWNLIELSNSDPNAREKMVAQVESSGVDISCLTKWSIPQENLPPKSTGEDPNAAKIDTIISFLKRKKKYKALSHCSRFLSKISDYWFWRDVLFRKIVDTIGVEAAFRFAKQFPEPYKFDFYQNIFDNVEIDSAIKLLTELKDERIEKSDFLIAQLCKIAEKLCAEKREQEAYQFIEEHILEILIRENHKLQCEDLYDFIEYLLTEDHKNIVKKILSNLSNSKKYYLPLILADRLKSKNPLLADLKGLRNYQILSALVRAERIVGRPKYSLKQIEYFRGLAEKAIPTITKKLDIFNQSQNWPYAEASRKRIAAATRKKEILCEFYARLFIAATKWGWSAAEKFNDDYIFFSIEHVKEALIKKYHACTSLQTPQEMKQLAVLFCQSLKHTKNGINYMEIQALYNSETSTPGFLSAILQELESEPDAYTSFLFHYYNEATNWSLPNAIKQIAEISCPWKGAIERMAIPSMQVEGATDEIEQRTTTYGS